MHTLGIIISGINIHITCVYQRVHVHVHVSTFIADMKKICFVKTSAAVCKPDHMVCIQSIQFSILPLNPKIESLTVLHWSVNVCVCPYQSP